MQQLAARYQAVRKRSMDICAPLKTEDYVVQPIGDVSPPKWHLGHTTWFFETFLLKPHVEGYAEFDPDYNFVFNSYYESVGARVIRTDRGNLSRPSVDDIFRYRAHVDEAMSNFLRDEEMAPGIRELVVLGFNHEEQHQELLYTDIKYILGHNPLFPAYGPGPGSDGAAGPNGDGATAHQSEDPAWHPGADAPPPAEPAWLSIAEGTTDIGHTGDGFCFDNELARHKVYLQAYYISKTPVTNREYLEFIEAGGYHDFRYWHAEGWDWVQKNKVEAPLYWYHINDEWMYYSWQGLQLLDAKDLVCHVSYYEAAAYAAWRDARLPTEAEWERAAPGFDWGRRWEWTESAYLPYPGFAKAPGAIGEYNGKFMVSQMVLRGASDVTPPGHSRVTYRNFFHPSARWQFTGIRLAK